MSEDLIRVIQYVEVSHLGVAGCRLERFLNRLRGAHVASAG